MPPLQGPVKIVDWTMKEKPLGTKITLSGNSLWHAVSQAILKDSVSSVIPSPMAPNFRTSNKPDTFWQLLWSLVGGGLGSSSGGALEYGGKGSGEGSGEGGLEYGDEGNGEGGSEISDGGLW